VTGVIAQNDIPVSDQTVALVYIIAALIMVAVAIVVIAWLASVVARLLESRRAHRERRG
jgi:heme/copper-type cytochrome/quinol oxidase subunit 2